MRGKTADELQEMLVGLRKEQFNLRFQRATGQLEAVGRIKEVRRDDRPGEDHHGGALARPPLRS